MDTQGLKLIDGKEKDLVQFIMFVIVSLMDNSNVLEMRKFPVFWFCLHSTMGGWEAGQGGADSAISQQIQHQQQIQNCQFDMDQDYGSSQYLLIRTNFR